jgi:membrane-bound inhibitor of C-type lysozyme
MAYRIQIMESKALFLTSIATLLLTSCSPANHASNQKANVATYVSGKGEVVTATYDIQSGTVQAILPDKSRVKFYQAISVSGARYTNKTGTFWEHQGEATYSAGDSIIFVGKVK